jgi:acetyl/propionyl-CoA carboxylase alpha subunit
VSRQSLAKAHQKIQELAWEPQYHEPYMKYKTDYTFRKAAKKDPLKQVLRSYFPMEEEKDNRVFGAMDGAIRGNMFRQVQERWMEWQKLFLSIIPFPEISAARAMPLAVATHVVRPSVFAETISATGTLRADESVELQAETSGKVIAIHFSEGSRVRKGDLLLKLNDAPLRAVPRTSVAGFTRRWLFTSRTPVVRSTSSSAIRFSSRVRTLPPSVSSPPLTCTSISLASILGSSVSRSQTSSRIRSSVR